MASAPPSSRAASVGAEPIGPTEDWLGYGQYADSLWARMQLALSTPWEQGAAAHTPITSRPGADPLVVGVYGEWGVGKSKLLELVYDRAVAENAQRLRQRSQDPEAWAQSPALHLVVPVWPPLALREGAQPGRALADACDRGPARHAQAGGQHDGILAPRHRGLGQGRRGEGQSCSCSRRCTTSARSACPTRCCSSRV